MQNLIKNDYVLFDPADYIDNPIALARIKAHLTQAQLAELLKVSQAYISKIERQKKVTAKLLNKVREAINKNHKSKVGSYSSPRLPS